MILQLPASTVVTSPVVGLTLANAVLELDQVPPVVPVELYVAVPLRHNGEVPLITPALTFGLTVKVLNADTGPPQPVTV